MRGTPERAQADDAVAGLIPARAGNTATERGQAREPSAHPRSRGEHRLTRLWVCWVLGSSPLARGTHSEGRRVRVVSGLIPAHAGNTYSPWRSGPSRSAHPRSREEHGSTRQMCGIWPDSSPLTQGTLGTNAQLVAQNRLIPARAGSTAAKALRTTTSAAHPRSRWEHSSVSIVCSTTHGSSPLARGTLGHRYSTDS